MKLTVLCAGVAAGLGAGIVTVASGQPTGLEALSVLARTKGAVAGNQVVVVSGERGAEQPEAWRLVARDPALAGQFREYIVRGGRVVSEQAVPPSDAGGYATAPLVRRQLKIDSQVVFWRAHTEAQKVLVGFDTVDYELRNAEFSTTPVWVVRLINQAGLKVGELALSAENGQVLRRAWFEAGRQTAQRTGTVSAPQRTGTVSAPQRTGTVSAPQRTGTVSAPQRTGSTAAISEKAQHAWEGTRTGWHQGKDAVTSGLRKASTTVGGWLLRAGGGVPPPDSAPSSQTASPNQTPTTPQTRGPATWQNGAYDSGARR